MNKKPSTGFTLIELMVAAIILAIISVVSYRLISSLVITKEVANSAQEKWGDLSLIVSRFGDDLKRLIPLTIRDQNGNMLPALLGKARLIDKYDAQLEWSISGSIGDEVYGTSPPKRVGYRFDNGAVYRVYWTQLNRVQSSKPEIVLLVKNVKNFAVEYQYQDKQWRDYWPNKNSNNLMQLPNAIRITLELDSGELIQRNWIL